MNATMDEEDQLLDTHLALLSGSNAQHDNHELTSTPIFTPAILKHFRPAFNQYGFLAGLCDVLDRNASLEEGELLEDPRLFFNISAPSSAFICGSQGSGKSHTLSCLLENCLMKSQVSKLESPLAGLVFHYDSFTSDVRGTPCEAAYLASHPNIKVRVLCSPTNLATIKRTYANMNVHVEALRIDQSDLNTKRMLDLMAVNTEDRMPLYLHSINRILRDLRMIQQENNEAFNYGAFKREVNLTDLTPAQLAPLNQRLDTLESFMPKSQTQIAPPIGPNSKKSQPKKSKLPVPEGNNWDVKPGTLTIVDLSCPCVTAEGACALFNMCLSIFLEQKTTIGRVIALDEAHKYMNDASEAASLTNTLLSAIRLQRHLGTRVFISTQEPTISPKLLDLCSITIVHRFTSPDWLQCLKAHLAALSKSTDDSCDVRTSPTVVFDRIVKLRVGEALVFAPSAVVAYALSDNPYGMKLAKLGVDFLKVKIRARVTADGGKSVLAIGKFQVQPMPLASRPMVANRQSNGALKDVTDASSAITAPTSKEILDSSSGVANTRTACQANGKENMSAAQGTTHKHSVDVSTNTDYEGPTVLVTNEAIRRPANSNQQSEFDSGCNQN